MGAGCCKGSGSDPRKTGSAPNKSGKTGGVLKSSGNGSAASLLLQGLMRKGADKENKTAANHQEKELKSISLANSSVVSPDKSKGFDSAQGTEFLRLSEVNDIKFSGLSPVKKVPDLVAKTSTKVWDFDILKNLYQSDKVFVYNCIDRASGQYFILKRIELSEDDMTEQNVKLCKQIVAYIRRKLIPLSHPNLVKYISVTFSAETRSRLRSQQRT